MRRIAKTDANQQSIIDALRRCGYSVKSLHQIGGGFPDLLVSEADAPTAKMWLLEIKTKTGRLTPDQIKFFEEWRGKRAHIVTCIEEALKVLQDG